jgi:flagellar biosynthesis protein FlhG
MSESTMEGRYMPLSPVTAPDDQATRLRALMETVQAGAFGGGGGSGGGGGASSGAAPRPVRAAHPVRPPERVDIRPEARAPALPIRHRADMVERRARLIALASGKGGVGKTNISVNLAIALSAMGKRSTLVDADLGLANADVLCGLMPARRLEHVVGVVGVTTGARSAQSAPAATSIRDIAVEAPGGFRLIPGAAGIARMSELTRDERARLLFGIGELERDSDLVLVDAAAGISRDVITFMQVADLGIVVATPEPTAITDAYALIKCVLHEKPLAQRAHHLRPDPAAPPPRARLALVVNQVADDKEAAAVHARIAGACSRFLGYQLPLLGSVVHDPRVSTAVKRRKPFLLDAPRARASDDIRRLATALARAVEPRPETIKPRRRGLSRLLAGIVLRGK